MSRRFAFLTALLCVCLVSSNILETKIFMLGPLVLTGGILIFPLSYVAGDCISEVYGYRDARFAILSAFVLNLLFLAAAFVACKLPDAQFWNGGEHFTYVLNRYSRITVASMAAFLAGALVNAKVMTGLHRKQGEKKFCLRAVISSIIGESVDSFVFFPLAFRGVEWNHLLEMMFTQIILKTLYEILILPLTAQVVARLKKAEPTTQSER